MKLIDKLAEDFGADGINNRVRVAAERGFIAGFTAAREMAKSMLTHSDDPRFNLYGALDKLGEEEI